MSEPGISFGLFGMYASGSRKIDSYEGGNEDAKQRVRESVRGKKELIWLKKNKKISFFIIINN